MIIVNIRKEVSMETKKCEICGRELPVSDFSKSYKNRCRECVARLTREKRAADKHSDAGCELIINPQIFDEKVWQTETDFKDEEYRNWVKSAVAVLQNIYNDIDGLIDDNKLYILGDVINLLDCADVKVKNGNKEYIGVKQSPKVTFPRVNEFDEGSSYRR